MRRKIHQRECPQCHRTYLGIKHQKFCSYSCARNSSPRPQCTPKRQAETVTCPLCNKLFTRGPHADDFKRKYCSKECVKVAQGNHLRQVRLLRKPTPRRGRSVYKRCCPVCNAEFSYTSRTKKTYCSKDCGAKAAPIGKKTFIEKEELESILKEHGTIAEAARKTKYTYFVLAKRAKEFGIKLKAPELKLRNDGYHSYNSPKNHRRVMEAHLGVSLLPKQGVHHIDGIKTSSDIDNLVVTNGTSEHMKIHASLQKCAFELVRRGVIVFDRADNSYKLPGQIDQRNAA